MNNSKQKGRCTAYLTRKSMSEKHFAKNSAYHFIPSENHWTLGLHRTETFDISILHHLKSKLKVAYLSLLTNWAETVSTSTFRSRLLILRTMNFPSNLRAFKCTYPQLSDSYKKNTRCIFNSAQTIGLTDFEPFLTFLEEQQSQGYTPKYLDIRKGAYSDIENNSISYAMRVATDKLLPNYKNINVVLTPTKLSEFGSLVAFHLLRGILRRPTQLTQLKWCDFLPVGEHFSDKVFSTELASSESLHVRIFKGKRSDFRGFAESRSIYLDESLTKIILLYHYHFFKTFVSTLAQQGYTFSQHELADLRGLVPVFPALDLFSTTFQSKQQVFKALSKKSPSFHKAEQNLCSLLRNFSTRHIEEHLQSERIPAAELKVTNNRIRHTALTNAARQGRSQEQLAAMTGVTKGAARHYVDLTNEARAEIDVAFSDNKVVQAFGRLSIAELVAENDSIIHNEFDEEIGIVNDRENCLTCKASIGKPLGCYPCKNFRPLATANHAYYLEKAERKLALNTSDAETLVLSKLKEIVSYITATINACEELRQLGEKEIL